MIHRGNVRIRRRTLVLFATAVLISVIGLLAGLREIARSRTFQFFGRIVPRVETAEKIVALTFDDGPNTKYTRELLDALSARKVHATFFVTGGELSAAPEAGRMILEGGHELGNHTWSHDRMILKSSEFYRKELEDTDAGIRSAGQKGEIYFRPPFCYKLFGLPWYLSRHGRTTVTWDLEPDSYPEVAATSTGIVAHVVERVRPGSIILLHVWYESRQTSRDAVPVLIDALQGKGFRFVTLSELLTGGSGGRT